MTLGKIYIYYGSDFIIDNNRDEFYYLLAAVALTQNVNLAAEPLFLYDENNETYIFCEHRIKKFIVCQANYFIKKMGQVYSNENMCTFTSLKQISKLIANFSGERKGLSAYSLIILHIIYEMINNSIYSKDFIISAIRHSNFNIKCNNIDLLIQREDNYVLGIISDSLYAFANQYLRFYRRNVFADFLVNCYSPVKKEIKENTISDIGEFPDIPRKQPN